MHPMNSKVFGNVTGKSIKIHLNTGVTGNATAVAVNYTGYGYASVANATFTNVGSGSGLSVTPLMGLTALSLPTVALAGSGGSNGTVTLTGLTGTGTKFQVNGVVVNNQLSSVSGPILVAGTYTALPNLANTPVSGGGLSNCSLNTTSSFGVTSYSVAGVGNGLYAQSTDVTLTGGTPTIAATAGDVTLSGGVGETGWIVKQTGTTSFRVTTDGVNFQTSVLDQNLPPTAPGQFTVLCYPVAPNGQLTGTVEHVKKLNNYHCQTEEGNKYIWALSNPGPYILATGTSGYAILETN